ncbi:hypothetical protein LCGC14_0815500 [marine sediment metagenome]|uniref:Uncharacterized protein n=1 Tax=marine sediment metagenome TaxID=412755 RepID=A0A0F9PKE9_9ZZZZ
MNIILNKEAPLELVRIIDQLDKETNCVSSIIIDAFIPALVEKKALGAYEIATRTILIDLGNCLTDSQWMKYGMLYIPGVWLNTLIAVYHEFAHACQTEEDIAITMLTEKHDAELLKIVEEEAMEDAMEHALEYFTNGGTTPPLKEMGWLGGEMAKVLNGVFHKIPLQVAEELNALKVGAAAEVNAASTALTRFNEENTQLLKDNIDKEQGGAKIENRYYMTMGEFIAAAKG